MSEFSFENDIAIYVEELVQKMDNAFQTLKHMVDNNIDPDPTFAKACHLMLSCSHPAGENAIKSASTHEEKQRALQLAHAVQTYGDNLYVMMVLADIM